MSFIDYIGPFVYGFILGYFWNPVWTLGKKIVSEARIAKEEWRNPRDYR